MRFVLAVDYDGTLFNGDWNRPGEPIMPVVLQTLRFVAHPHCDVILWTCREERLLVEAIERCEALGIMFDAVNTNTYETLEWNKRLFKRLGNTCGRKIHADLYVDNKANGSIDHFLSLDPEVEWQKVKSRND